MNAAPGDFADTVLMPGDPLRARYIATAHLDNARQVTDVRNMLGFTGEYRGERVSVMAHGMGIPSASIYVTELLRDYNVKRILRVGSCGTVLRAAPLREVIIGLGACTDSGVNRMRFGGYDYAPIASFDLVRKSVDAAAAAGIQCRVGNLFSADLFYTPDTDMFDTMERFNILGVEMEAAGIYALAAEHDAEAVALCTVSDNIRTGEKLTHQERSDTFDDMIRVALEAAVAS